MNYTIKNTLTTFGIICIALAGQGCTDEKPTKQPESTEKEGAAQEDPLKRDHAAIQGTWKVVAMRAAGNPAPDQVVAVVKYQFNGEKLIVTPAEPGTSDYTFSLDPSAKPIAACDMALIGSKDPADTMKGIYILDGDKLKICMGKNERPTQMSAEVEDGFGQMLVELERENP